MRPLRLIVLLSIVALLAAPTLAAAAAQPAQQAKQTQGQITAVDEARHTLELAQPMGEGYMTLKVDERTRIRGPEGAPAQFSSLREGDRIWASYERKGREHVASQITILAPGGARPAPGM